MAEPCARNTLPAIAWAVNNIHQKDADAVIGVFASDHAIDNQSAFLEAWKTAEVVAEAGYLVLLGIKPHEPATGYGYIKPAKLLKDGTMPVYEVAQFVEKPNVEKAIQFVKDGYLWNSGMFVFKASVFMQMLAKYQPEMTLQLSAMTSGKFCSNVCRFYQYLNGLRIGRKSR